MPATYEPIATTTLGSAAANITFSSIGSGYTDVRIVLVGSTSTQLNPTIQFNSDTGTNYSCTAIRGDGQTAFSTRITNSTGGFLTIGNFESGKITMVTVDVFSYAGSTNKTCLSAYALDKNTTNGSGNVGRNVILWRNTSAITSIKLDTQGYTFETGTTATLYGILKA